MAVSPTGNTVFVTGYSDGGNSGDNYATIAYNAATGARRWVGRYNGHANGDDLASAVAVSPGGGTVYVTGASSGTTSGTISLDYATVAYNAGTGARLWARRYSGPGNGADQATSLAVSPARSTVFVTGSSFGSTSVGSDFATIAYKG